MVGSTPTRFRQIPDDSIAFVGVRTRKNAYKQGVLDPNWTQISQRPDMGSIPIARSINPVDAVGFTGFHPRN